MNQIMVFCSATSVPDVLGRMTPGEPDHRISRLFLFQTNFTLNVFEDEKRNWRFSRAGLT